MMNMTSQKAFCIERIAEVGGRRGVVQQGFAHVMNFVPLSGSNAWFDVQLM